MFRSDLVQETFLKAKEWVKELGRHITGDIVISLAGNKSDLGNLRMVPTKVGLFLSFSSFCRPIAPLFPHWN